MDHWSPIEVHQNEGESEGSIEDLKDPFELAMNDDWEGLKRYYEMKPQKLKLPMTVNGDTIFHVAASCIRGSQGKEVLEFLLNSLMSTYGEKCKALRLTNYNGNNTLHEVALSGNLETAEFLVSHFNNPAADVTDDATLPLLETRNQLGETPLYRAAAIGHSNLVRFYTHKAKTDNPDNVWQHFYRNDKMSILHIAVIGQHFETALWLQRNYEFLATQKEDKGLTSLQLVAQMPTAFVPPFRQNKWMMLIYKCLPVINLVTFYKDDLENSLDSNQPHQSKKISGAGGLQGILDKMWKEEKNQKALMKLIHLLVEKDYSWETTNTRAFTKTISLGSADSTDADRGNEQMKAASKSTEGDQPELKVYDFTPLLIATITGIVPIVKEILEQHPQAAEHVSYNEQNILHLAIKYRCKHIFKLIKSRPRIFSRLNERIDRNGNTILHQASDTSYYSIALYQKLIGPAMLLQRELRWVLRVQKIVPPHYAMHRNNKDQTAEDLFNACHNDLLKSAQEWMKDTAQSCSTVAVLVVGVVFAASYAFPEGNGGGKPDVQDSPLFWLFTSMDVVAISSSLSSVAFFLSILSSPLEYPHFCRSLPRKVMIGFVLLFVSMATTMIAFAASILLLIRLEKKWTKSLFYPVAFFPVPLFGLMQFPMYQTGKVIGHTATKILWYFLFPFRQLRRCCTKKSRPHRIMR